MSLTIKAVMKEESQSMAPLPTKPTMKQAEEKEEEDKEQKLKANPLEGTLVVVEQGMKKGGNCGMVGPGLLDVFLRLGFLKVESA